MPPHLVIGGKKGQNNKGAENSKMEGGGAGSNLDERKEQFIPDRKKESKKY